MTPEQFCYWLRGSFELGNMKSLDANQFNTVKRHLELVFTDVTNLQAPSSVELNDGLEDVVKPKKVPLKDSNFYFSPSSMRYC